MKYGPMKDRRMNSIIELIKRSKMFVLYILLALGLPVRGLFGVDRPD